jgi:arylsulfatase
MNNKNLKFSAMGLAVISGIALSGCKKSSESEVTQVRPNILIIMADDLGYSDLGSYGGEIHTPNLDDLAENGIRFTQFYNAARCCPSRASLLTGKYPHQAGMALNGQNLRKDAATIAEILRGNGYQTGLTGKWHLSETRALSNHDDQLRWLSNQDQVRDFAPVETYPYNRGFDEHYGVIWGVVNFFDPFSLVHNEKPITEVTEDFYITDFINDKSVELIGNFSRNDKPFFLYVAHTAPHWPLHALPEDIDKYRGMYDDGWDKLRENRYHRLLEIGLFSRENTTLPPNDAGVPWDDYPDKMWEAHHMEAHAAMVDRMDQGIGRIIRKLEDTGQLDNTLIIFLSDNGASPERGYRPGFDRPGHKRNGETIQYIINSNDTIRPGPQDTWGYLGNRWAGAINSPFRYWKMQSYEGGICTPLIIHWPAGLKGKENTINHGVGHVIDILPTCLELAGAKYPAQINGLETTPPAGRSLLPVIRKESTATNDTLFWEHEGGRAFRTGNWKIAALTNGPWELFNLTIDRTESTNLAEEHPERLAGMIDQWEKFHSRIHPKNSVKN